MPLTKATTNVVNLDKDTLINGITAGRGAGNFDSNTVFGSSSLNSNITGIKNIAVGPNALDANTNGSNNTAVGASALAANVLANNNTAVGFEALKANQDGSNNTAVGAQALDANIDGYSNTAVGLDALGANTNGFSNTAVGVNSLESNTVGISNTAVGFQALIANVDGNNNTAVGKDALDSNTIGGNNVAVGREALAANVSGNDNIAIGYLAGSINTGSDNIFIGKNASGTLASISNQVNIYNGSVTARFTGAASAWTFTSDERDKKNIEDLNIGLDFINQLKARKFAWDMRNSDVDKGREASGFVAQEVLQVVNDNNAAYTGLVDANNPEQYTLAATNLIPILVKAVQELSAKVAELEAK